MPRRKYVPGIKKLPGPKVVLSYAEYTRLLRAEKPVPRGAQLALAEVPETTLGKLKIRFHADGTIEFPYYKGPEGKLKRVRFIRTKTIPSGVRLVYHQIESVKSRIIQAERIFDEVSKLHFDLEHKWNRFNTAQKRAFSLYFNGLLGELAQNPNLLQEENKIHACKRFQRARELLGEENPSAASAAMRAIKNDLLDWKRKLKLQTPRLERRRSMVVDRKFQKDLRIFRAVDTLRSVMNSLRTGIEARSRERIARELLSAVRDLNATGLSKFKQAGIIAKKAAEFIRKGNLAKAGEYIRAANKKTVLAASPISSIYPDKLREIQRSVDSGFKRTVLTNQIVLFHDMMEFWWNPKSRPKTQLILETVTELAELAKNMKIKHVPEMLLSAKKELEKNNLVSFALLSAKAAAELEPSQRELML